MKVKEKASMVIERFKHFHKDYTFQKDPEGWNKYCDDCIGWAREISQAYLDQAQRLDEAVEILDDLVMVTNIIDVEERDRAIHFLTSLLFTKQKEPTDESK